MSRKTKGCTFDGPWFGAPYPDAVCIDGYLWDADSGGPGEDGIWLFDSGGEEPCPQCNTEASLRRVVDDLSTGHSGTLPNDQQWRNAVKHHRRLNPKATAAALRKIGPIKVWTPTENNDKKFTVVNKG